jgi:Ca-activated chloride channel family protein
MCFLRPELLWLLLLLPTVGLAAWWGTLRRNRALRRFAGGTERVARFTGEVSAHRRAAKLLLLCLALAAVIVAVSRPQWGSRLEPITRSGVDVVVVIDTSLSMAAEDLAPNRLEQAKHQVDLLLERLAGNRVALVTFAGQSTLACPLTLDHAALRLFLDTVEAESVQVAGTALAEALRTGARAFGEEGRGVEPRTRALVLFSDGEDHEGELEQLPRELKQAGIGLYAMGCGSTRGAPIPLRDAAGGVSGYKKDREGKVVTTRLDESVLEALALESGGRYYRSTPGGQEVEAVVEAIAALDAREYGSVLRTRYEDRFQIPLAVGLLALCAETLIGDRRGQRRRSKRSEVS